MFDMRISQSVAFTFAFDLAEVHASAKNHNTKGLEIYD